MKIHRLDAHDRFQHFTNQNFDISECCQDMIKNTPFGDYPFYIFVHPRTEDDGANKRLIWQPRLTKPKAQTNSMLFKAYPGTDLIKVIWMIPDKALWDQYKKGNLTENKTICESIYNFENNRAALEAKEEDDLSEAMIDKIYRELSFNARKKKEKTAIYDKI